MSDPYLDALRDVEELLDNAKSNGGGIHFGDMFIQNAHWDFELRDQIALLRDARTTLAELKGDKG